MTIRIYHNPRCSKSRATLALIEARCPVFEIVRYLETPLEAKEIADLVAKLGLYSVREMVRIKEAPYKELGLDNADEAALINAIIKHPILLERPIVVNGPRAAIGRPPEAVLPVLEKAI